MQTSETQTTAVAAGARRRRGAWDVEVRLHVDRRQETPAVERLVRRRIAWLRRHFPDLESCRVTVDVPNHRRRGGRLHRVRVGLVLGGAAVRAARSATPAAYEDPLAAVRDAFAAAHRELDERVHRRDEQRRIR